MELIKASLMVAAGMGGGANLQHNPTFTSNGEKNPPAGYDGFDKVTIAIPLTEKTCTANGDYYNNSGGGWDVVHVRVPEGYTLPPTPLPPMPMDIVENLTDTTINIVLKKRVYYRDPDHSGKSGYEFYYIRWVGSEKQEIMIAHIDTMDTHVARYTDAFFTLTDPSTGAWEATVTQIYDDGRSPSVYNWTGTNRDLINFGDPTHTTTLTNDKKEEEQT